ncbi:MAG: solute-binding protein, partial [Chloroflexi bacterium]|nr:solute-binding protein [Chloroflexota bacterium]
MTDALVEIGDAYEAESGVNVTFSFGGSNALARQVEFGAPADAVIFAGSGPMDQLEASGDVVAGSTFTTANIIMVCDGDDKTIDEPS